MKDLQLGGEKLLHAIQLVLNPYPIVRRSFGRFERGMLGNSYDCDVTLMIVVPGI